MIEQKSKLRQESVSNLDLGGVTISFRRAGGRLVKVTLDRASTQSERDQVAAIAEEVIKRQEGPRQPRSSGMIKVKGCDDGELFRSWAIHS
jgi:hypothetical protein